MGLPQPDPSPGLPNWYVSYGDMMSLLLTFFIMLYSVSEIKHEEKYKAMFESLHKIFGDDLSMVAGASGAQMPTSSQLANLASLGRARRADIMNSGVPVESPVGDRDRLTTERPDIDPTVGGIVHFDEGSDVLTPQAKQAIEVIVRYIAGMPQKVEVRGHTSNQPLPPGSPYRDHEDLGYARARKVEKELIRLGIRPERIRITTAGSHELKYRGSDPLLQKDNPRVEVLLLSETIDVKHEEG